MDIFHICILSQVFYNCDLPDVGSGVIVLSCIISLVLAMAVVGAG